MPAAPLSIPPTFASAVTRLEAERSQQILHASQDMSLKRWLRKSGKRVLTHNATFSSWKLHSRFGPVFGGHSLTHGVGILYERSAVVKRADVKVKSLFVEVLDTYKRLGLKG